MVGWWLVTPTQHTMHTMHRDLRYPPRRFTERRTIMKSIVLWALIALNALLLISFLGRVTKPNAAMAQVAGGGAAAAAAAPAGNSPRRPGDYLMVPGEVPGGTTSLVYVV